MSSSRDTMMIFSIFFIFILSQCNAQTNDTLCRDEVTCSARGVCVIPDPSDPYDWYCKCDEGFVTFPEPNSTTVDPIYCNYQQKQQLVAFLLSFFVGMFAAGRFYCGLWLSAGLKIGLNVGLGCFGMCCISCITGVSVGVGSMGSTSRTSNKFGDGCCAKVAGCFGCCYVFLVSLGIVAWIITDWVLFGLNELPDENGVSLKPW